MTQVLTRQELFDMFITELQNQSSKLTDTSDGSIVDLLAGVTAQVLSEVNQLTVDEFKKTFFETANGPAVTGGADNLETLAVDHFGDSFARPAASKATGTVTFSRPNDDEGEVTIPAGTVVETEADANGEKQQFETDTEAKLGATDLSVDADVTAQEAGTDGNVAASKITGIESTLTDSSITVTNSAAMSGGADEESDAEYRETIRDKLQSLKGATLSALESKAKSVSGVSTATAIEKYLPVIEYDIGGASIAAGAEFFRLPYGKIYIADTNGNASDSLVSSVQDEIDDFRAAGVKVEVIGASAVSINWEAEYTLDPGGPNYTELSSDATKIVDSMKQYLADLAIGTDFVRDDADAAILAIWGSGGTGDLTAFSTKSPVGDVTIQENEKAVSGTVKVI